MTQKIGLPTAVSLVVGTTIGTGVFLKVAPMSQTLQSPWLVILAWIIAGALSLAGAITYSELASKYPKAGGEYIYLKESYGDLLAFLYGWQRFIISAPATIAAYSVGAATFLKTAWPEQPLSVSALAVSFVLIFSAANLFKISVAGGIQNIFTVIKVTILLLITGGSFFLAENRGFINFQSTLEASTQAAHLAPSTLFQWLSAFGVALISALWAYDGWNNLPMVAAEVESPRKNMPKALIWGMISIITIYVLVHLGYFYSQPINMLAISNSTAYPNALPAPSLTVQSILGGSSVAWLGFAMLISALGAMNGSVMTNARVPTAMSHDHLFFSFFKKHNSYHAPVVSIVAQGLLAMIFAVSGSFDQLTNYVVFASWIFYALTASAVFKLRQQKQTLPFEMVGYPVLPIIFIGVSLLLLANTLYTSLHESLIGVLIILLGIPIYKFRQRLF